MGESIQNAICGFAGKYFALTWLAPAALMFAANLVYIAVKVIRELDKRD